MSAFGQFLELGVPAPDIQASLDFYRRLGFSELATGDIRPYFYAAVTDGQIVIGLHSAGLEQPALGFVRPELAAHLAALTAGGPPTAFTRLGVDQFHEAGLLAPDDILLLLMEARTCSAAGIDEAPPPLPGRSTEISLRCTDPERALAFWTAAGFLAVSAAPDGPLTLSAAGLTLGLRPDLRRRDPLLRFEPPEPSAVLHSLDALGLATRPHPEGRILEAPEGTALLIVAG